MRDGLLDIKVKTGETPEGYEIFQPRGKFQFPVKREDLATILSHLKVDDARSSQETYTIDEFIAMARKHPDLVAGDRREDALRLHHRRDHLRVRAGLLQRRAGRVGLRRERELRRRCARSSKGSAWRRMPNVNYLRAAKRVVGMESATAS